MARKTTAWNYQLEERIEEWVNISGGQFEEAYRYLRSTTRFRAKVCFVGAWLSLKKDDRGELATIPDLANWLGVHRNTVYDWRIEFLLDDWAEQLRLMELHGMQLGDVDRVTYSQAVNPESPVDARRLYYQRAGVLGQEITVHTKTQKEKMSEWLMELRGEADNGAEVAELGAEASDLPALEISTTPGADSDSPG